MTKAKVRFKVTGEGMIGKIKYSNALAEQLEAISEPVWVALQSDSNETFVASLRRKRFYSHGRRGRVSIQMGAQPTIGRRIQAKRGVFTRALARGGLK